MGVDTAARVRREKAAKVRGEHVRKGPRAIVRDAKERFRVLDPGDKSLSVEASFRQWIKWQRYVSGKVGKPYAPAPFRKTVPA